MMRLVALALILLTLSIPARAQAQPSPVANSALGSKDANKKGSKPAAMRHAVALPPEKAKPVSITRFEKPPIIDGNLDEDIWKRAMLLKDFYQTQPGD
ncbi:MAG TPA: hypothetical protein VF747_03045, partial [Blastocatellia bacterium]